MLSWRTNTQSNKTIMIEYCTDKQSINPTKHSHHSACPGQMPQPHLSLCQSLCPVAIDRNTTRITANNCQQLMQTETPLKIIIRRKIDFWNAYSRESTLQWTIHYKLIKPQRKSVAISLPLIFFSLCLVFPVVTDRKQLKLQPVTMFSGHSHTHTHACTHARTHTHCKRTDICVACTHSPDKLILLVIEIALCSFQPIQQHISSCSDLQHTHMHNNNENFTLINTQTQLYIHKVTLIQTNQLTCNRQRHFFLKIQYKRWDKNNNKNNYKIEKPLMRDHPDERLTLKIDHPDKRPPWWETTLMKDDPDERPPW